MVTDAEALPERFQLIVQPSGDVTQARIDCRSEGCCGVAFLDVG
jgi:hypothetical protein